jgi:hypothetical protein
MSFVQLNGGLSVYAESQTLLKEAEHVAAINCSFDFATSEHSRSFEASSVEEIYSRQLDRESIVR